MTRSTTALWGLLSVVTVVLVPAALSASVSDVGETKSTEQPAIYQEKSGAGVSASSSTLADDLDDDEDDDDVESESDIINVDERVANPRANFTNSCECGQKQNRIVGGHETHVSEYPWQVALVHAQSGQLFCGGSLITDRHVLSAAHCIVLGPPAARIMVHLRDHNLSNSSETQVVKRRVVEILNHEKFNDVTKDNDIAILKLSSPVTISSSLLPVCLPSSARPKFGNKEAIVTGWGALKFEGPTLPTLQEVTVPVLSQKNCRKNTKFEPSDITDQMLCAGKAGLSPCQGDSGGPLIYREKKGRYQQIGVASFIGSKECAAEGFPAVFTRVTMFLGWIENRTKDGVYCSGFHFP